MCSYFARHRVNVEEPRRESEPLMTHRRASGWILNQDSLRTLRENMLWYPLSFIICNTKPIGHQVLKMLESARKLLSNSIDASWDCEIVSVCGRILLGWWYLFFFWEILSLCCSCCFSFTLIPHWISFWCYLYPLLVFCFHSQPELVLYLVIHLSVHQALRVFMLYGTSRPWWTL